MRITITTVKFDNGEELRMTPYAISWFDANGNLLTQTSLEDFLNFVREKLPTREDKMSNQNTDERAKDNWKIAEEQAALVQKLTERENARTMAIQNLITAFQGRATGFAKMHTEKGDALSNEYLTVISDIQHNIDLSITKM